MQGRYALIKTKFDGGKGDRNWLFFKCKQRNAPNIVIIVMLIIVGNPYIIS